MSERKHNLDLLRIICTFLIILLHLGSYYAVVGNIQKYPDFYISVGTLAITVSRVAVPSFIMLSGYLILGNPRNKSPYTFYRKTIIILVIPAFFFSFIYVLYSLYIEKTKSMYLGTPANYMKPLKDWLNGVPFYHMWYIYMLLGLYLISPLFIRLIEKMNGKP